MPKSRAHALITLATALACGDLPLHPGVDRDEAAARLLALPGVGAWTTNYIRMRALSDPDAWLATDAGIVRALARLGGTVTDALAWRPWRSYATHHLWAILEEGPPARNARQECFAPTPQGAATS
jgi:AraC family transcriptional regulator of adaptative response / DNA-3-methyladenine glycosylase II